MDKDILSALNFIDPTDVGYQEWTNIGMALKLAGADVSVWDEWSQQDMDRYHPGECGRKWDTFSRTGGDVVTAGTVVQMAKDRGWKPNWGVFEWDSWIEYDGDGTEDSSTTILNADDWRPEEDLRRYIEALFDPDDHVSYVTKAYEQDGRLVPGKGTYSRTAADILAGLDQYSDVKTAIGDYNPDAGAWIRFNPMDGRGVGNDNVTAYKYALVESDDMSTVDQEAMWHRLQLPIAAMVTSGGKSIHAIVRVDAADAKEYRERVQFLYDWIEQQEIRPGKHVTIDRQNKNPSRLSRMPGVARNGQQQRLIAVNIGKGSWKDWVDWTEGEKNDLPEILSFRERRKNPLPLAPVQIEGVLRRGHKCQISGPSKSGKSFSLIQLAVAIAEGGKWFGLQCTQGTVLYVNLEIDPPSADERIRVVYDAMAPAYEHDDNLLAWHLRGRAQPLDELVPKMIRALDGIHLDAIILDPIYKIITGDENSATDMGRMCNEFDKLAQETGASVVYCHHHSKGAKGASKSIDRSSGSGVFGRDPDAIVDMTPLQLTADIVNNVQGDNAQAFRVTFTLREFAPKKPVDVWFRYPLHIIDESGELAALSEEGSQSGNLSKSSKKTTKAQRKTALGKAFDMNFGFDPASGSNVSIADMATSAEVTEKTIKNWLDEFKDEYGYHAGICWRLKTEPENGD